MCEQLQVNNNCCSFPTKIKNCYLFHCYSCMGGQFHVPQSLSNRYNTHLTCTVIIQGLADFKKLYLVGEAVAPPSKPLPVIPPVGRRNVPKPPIPDDHTGRPLPPPPQVQQPKTIHVTSDDYENMFYGLWDCDTSISHELAFSSGDIIHVVDKDHDGSGWWTGLLNGKIGLVPKSYLSAAYAAA